MARHGIHRPGATKIASAVLVVALVLAPASAQADAPAPALAPAPAAAPDLAPAQAQAQTLFERGRERMDAGDLAEACGFFAESQRLDPGGGTLLNLAVCHEREGRLATAWVEYHDAKSAAVRDHRADREALATERIQVIEPRLPHLLVTLPAGAPDGTEVKLDGAALSRLALGAPLPVDPGAHEVRATAPGFAPWSMQVAAIEDGQSVPVVIPAFHPPEVAAPAAQKGKLATGAYVTGSVALAGYATMAITGALALAAQSSADQACSSVHDFCADPSGPADASRATTLAWVSTISLGVALAATAAAIFWPRTKGQAAAAARSWTIVGVSPAGLAGSF